MRAKRNRQASKDDSQPYPSPHSLTPAAPVSPVEIRRRPSPIAIEDVGATFPWINELQDNIPGVPCSSATSDMLYDFNTPLDLVNFPPQHADVPNEDFTSSMTTLDATSFDQDAGISAEDMHAPGTASLMPGTTAMHQGSTTPSSAAQGTKAHNTTNSSGGHNSDSQCVLACCQIISQLESFINARVRVLDLTLEMIKKTIKTMSSLMQRDSRSGRCHLLLTVIMQQVMDLLETGCSDFLKETASASKDGELPEFDSIGGILSGFGFGGFQVGANEQRAWRAKVVIKELHGVQGVLQRLHDVSSDSSRQEKPCQENLERRLAVLLEQFGTLVSP
ncbi:MAG: hypothetical protein Q9165_008264 [Trypethelium subeluteriae]